MGSVLKWPLHFQPEPVREIQALIKGSRGKYVVPITSNHEGPPPTQIGSGLPKENRKELRWQFGRLLYIGYQRNSFYLVLAPRKEIGVNQWEGKWVKDFCLLSERLYSEHWKY